MMRHSLQTCALLWICLLMAGLPALAQQETATITGVVQDPSGAVIPGANVRLTNLGTNIASSTVTNEAGFYTVTHLKPGPYSVTVEKQGFKKFVQSGVTLQVNQAARLDISLQLGAQAEIVEVTAEAPLVETESANRGAVIDQRKIVDLPLNGRDYNQLALLSPGVLQATPRFGISALQFKGAFNANGNRVFMNVFLLDGLDNVSYSNSYRGENVQVVQPSIDALQEFKIQTSNYSAEFGRSAGAIVNATIKSGTNAFHGALYEFLRNEKLDARNFFAPTKPARKRNQFGGSVGGPIFRNRTFFFGDYEGLRDREGQTHNSNVATADMKRGIYGSTPMFNPFTTRTEGGRTIRDQFAGNRIPEAMWDPVAVKMLQPLPDPNQVGPFNFVRTVVNSNRTDQFDTRIDHQWSERLNLFGRYSFVDTTVFRPGPLPGLAEGSFVDSFGTTANRSQSVAAGGTRNFGARNILDIRWSWVRGSYNVFPPNFGSPCPGELLGINNAPTEKSICGGMPKINVSSFSAFGRHTSTPQIQQPTSLNTRGTFTRTHGRHLLKAGIEHLYVQTPIRDISAFIGNLSFNGQMTQNPVSRGGTGNSIGDLLLGVPQTFTLSSNVVFDQYQHMWFYFFQDDFKVTPKLTLNWGLRYEYASPVREKNNRFANLDLSTGQFVFAKDGGLFERALIHPDRNNWGPRLGFAWTPLSRTVIRGGYGVFYNHTDRNGREGLMGFNPPYLIEPTLRGDGLNPLRVGTFQFLLREGYPPNLLDPVNISPDVSRKAQFMFRRAPYIQQWSFGIQRELFTDVLLDVAYVGNMGTKLPGFRNLNQARIGPESLAARRPIQPFADIQFLENHITSNFHSLQVRAEKRFSKGLAILGSYTYGKALSTAPEHLATSGAGNGIDAGRSREPQDNFNIRDEYGPAEFDVTHRFVATYIWQIPVGKGQRFFSGLAGWKQAVFGGWQVNGINTFQTGLGLTLRDNAARLPGTHNLGGDRRMRPDIIGPLVPSGFRQGPQLWFDTTKVVDPPVTATSGVFGNAGVGNFRGPGLKNVDFSVFKNFYVTESKYLQFRTEIFNTFNFANFGQPGLQYAGSPTSGGFGAIPVTSTPARIIQFGLKFYY